MKVAFIGLGTMGYSMAGHLQKQWDVTVYNRSIEKAIQWQQDHRGQYVESAREACMGADLVMSCVGNDDDLRQVCYGREGILAALKKGAVLIDHTTTSGHVAEEIAKACRLLGCDFIDAPVSGGEIGAQRGELTIMVGGSHSAFEKSKPALEHYAKHIAHMGEVGAGQNCKMVNQLCIAGVLQGLAEGLTLAQRAGLDIVQVRDVLKHGAAQSWQLEQRAQTMSENRFDFGFAIDWMRKDLRISLERGQELGLDLPLATMVDKAYQILQEQGLNRMDTSVLIKATQQQLLVTTPARD
ncbi:NAD(P)-dependent oxidoreductase [Pseudoteredinibacter isoporae]